MKEEKKEYRHSLAMRTLRDEGIWFETLKDGSVRVGEFILNPYTGSFSKNHLVSSVRGVFNFVRAIRREQEKSGYVRRKD